MWLQGLYRHQPKMGVHMSSYANPQNFQQFEPFMALFSSINCRASPPDTVEKESIAPAFP